MGSAHEGIRTAFLESVIRYPNATALIIGKQSWTYSELDVTARRWATLLHEASGRKPSRVGIYAYRSFTAYAGILAALYAGAAFVPLNRKFPIERTRYMMGRAGLDAMIVDQMSASGLAAWANDPSMLPPMLQPETDGTLGRRVFCRSACDAAGPLQMLPATNAQDMVYLLFTSGSTGQPKGVPITHGNLQAFIDCNAKRYALGPSDRLSQTFDLTFDLSMFDMFMAWQAGAAVCVLQPIELLAPFKSIERHGITTWFSVPSVASHLMRNGLLKPGSMPGLRWSLFCGEALPRGVAEAWQAAAPNAVLENLYGPTELTIACFAYRWDRVRSPSDCAQDIVPIGLPYANQRVLLVDPESLQDADQGEIGELCVTGPQMFSGYWRSPELDADRFVERGSEEHGGRTRYYRTGDLVRLGSDGAYEFVGRVDQQVKIGGYRVELGEIEAALRIAGCTDAVVLLCVSPTNSDPALHAVVCGPDIVVERLRNVLLESLPAYMIPAAIHPVASLPFNANGKVDRSALKSALQSGDLPFLNSIPE